MDKPMVEMRNISFTADGVRLLTDVSLKINSGEVCAIVGENGAGKTVLMKILSGALKKEAGEILFYGSQVKIDSVREAKALGIFMIYHEDNLIKEFTVLENLFLGNNITRGKFFIHKRQQKRLAKEVMEKLQVELPLDEKATVLNATQKKVIELMRALICDAKLLILDEITANCSLFESDILFHIVHKLKELGVTIIFISHRMDEILKVSEKIYIMNGGHIVDEEQLKDTNKRLDMDAILLKMTGKELANRYPRTKNQKGAAILEVKNVSLKNTILSDASMYIKRGEIVGITGLYGAGKTSLIKLISGQVEPSAGDVFFDGISVKGMANSDFVRKNIAYMSYEGDINLIQSIDVKENIVLSNLKGVSRHGLVKQSHCVYVAKDYISRMNLKNVTPDSSITNLSKGTQQKVALSKWINADARVLIFDEPTANLDLVSKTEFYNIINIMAQKGKAIFIASSDLSELSGMCDRIYVLYKGGISAEFDERNKSLMNIMQAVIGKQSKPNA